MLHVRNLATGAVRDIAIQAADRPQVFEVRWDLDGKGFMVVLAHSTPFGQTINRVSLTGARILILASAEPLAATAATSANRDEDGDEIPDAEDNCPADANRDQTDQDGDGAGDICDSDRDGDAVANTADNCADIANPGQENQDADAAGDVCDADVDGDGRTNAADNCSTIVNAGQENQDGDEFGDACDSDVDGDGVEDAGDNCPAVPNPDQADADGDTHGDPCDADRDGDGQANGSDNCPDAPNADQADWDDDGQGDACDPDRPPAEQIADLQEAVERLQLPGGTSNSLHKKLQGALEAYNPGDTEGACSKLASFLHEVRAQAGKKIPPAEADALMADAELIRRTIGC